MAGQSDGALALDAATFGDPQALLRQVGTSSPVHLVALPDGMPVWLITGYKEGRKALSDPRLVRSSKAAAPELQKYLGLYEDGFFPHSMVFNDRPDHTRMKQVVSQAFTPRRMEALRPGVQRIADELIDAIAGQGHADVLESLALKLPNAVICEWFGVPPADREQFARICGVVTGLAVTTGEDELREAGVWFDNYLTELIEERRTAPGDDMISVMLQAQQENRSLSDIELRSNIFLMLIGSVETAVNMVSNGLLALLKSPESVALLRADPNRVPAAVEEMLRIDPPVLTVMYHFATEDLTIGGVEIRRGDHLAVSLAAANYDEKQFPEPATFDIERANGPHLALSHGIHFCLGAPLARLEGQVFFETLLRRLDDIQLAVPAETLAWKPSFLVHRLERLPVTFRARVPAAA